MKLSKKILSILILTSISSVVLADEKMPTAIVKDKKALVPVTKTQVIQTVDGEKPVRTTHKTVLGKTKEGTVSHNVTKIDQADKFSKSKMAKPQVIEKSVTIPTSKVRETATLTENGKVVGTTEKLKGRGTKFEDGKAPVTKELKATSHTTSEGGATRVKVKADGEKKADVTVVTPAQ